MLLKKVKKKTFKVGIIGLGYVGLPRSIQFCKKNIQVYGIDTDQSKTEILKKGKSYITNVKNNEIAKNIKRKLLIPTSDFSCINKLDVIIICVPTPLDKKLKPNLNFIKNTFTRIKNFLRKDQLVCLESTSYPGTTYETIITNLINKFNLGKNFYIGYSPERNDPGIKDIYINDIPKLVSGYTKSCLEITENVYKIIFKKTVRVKNIRLAEMTKLYENIYRAINIGFVNEMKKVCTKMNLDIDEIIKAAKTKPFGFKAFYPGPGLGGHCIPVDPFYLTWKAKEYNVKTEFINLAGKVNRSIPDWVVNQLKFHLKNKKNINSLKKKKILILGIAYKKNINDCRESPAFEIIKILEKSKSIVDYSDPYFDTIPKLRNYKFKFRKSIVLKPSIIKQYDATILVTDHDKFDYKLISKNSKLILDTRHVFDKKNKKIIYC
jgi:UDP-N-acetyl-D-glucosamine dehydrogenase